MEKDLRLNMRDEGFGFGGRLNGDGMVDNGRRQVWWVLRRRWEVKEW